MQADLPLQPLHPLLPVGSPFTPAAAWTVGVPRAALERRVRHGVVRRVLRGVYVDAAVPYSRELRGQALALVVPPGRVVRGRSAAWLYDVPEAGLPERLETVDRRSLPGRDVRTEGEVLVTTPLRTALDLARELSTDRGVATLDGFLRRRLVSHVGLVAELPGLAGRAGVRRLREALARADGRAGSAVESVLRLRWLDARLPTPVPRLRLGEEWLELGLPPHRFGAVLAGRLAPAQLAALRTRGWGLVELSATRVLGTAPELVSGHLEREFHRHLLAATG